MDTTHTSGPFELHAPGAFSPTIGDWVITSGKSPDPGTWVRYTVVGTVPAHAEGHAAWEYPTDEELRAIALMFAAAPALLAALERLSASAANVVDNWESGDLAGAVNDLDDEADYARAAIAQAGTSI